MIRLTLLSLFVFGLCVYAWRDWYKSLCGLVVLTALVEHPDMPKTILGVQGLNPWNITLLIILLAWLLSRGSENLKWDMQRSGTLFLTLYVGLMLTATMRLLLDPLNVPHSTVARLVGEYLINTFKWIIPGLLLFTGCRSRERFVWALGALLGFYFVLGLLVIRWMPPSVALSGNELSSRALKILINELGFHRVNLSMLLAGAAWAVLATRPLFKRAIWPVLGFLSLSYAQALTGGRAGYVTWGVVGLMLCTFRWRRYLLLVPVAAIAISIALPGVVDRLTQGFTQETRDLRAPSVTDEELEPLFEGEADAYTITSGRTFAWPFVIEKIKQAPVLGYGRQAMRRTGLAAYLQERYSEEFPHPHNAYLELLLDNGFLGAMLVLPFYLAVLWRGFALFSRGSDDREVVAGGVTLALVLALLVASMGSQTFYPREGAVGMWCAIGLTWRTWTEKQRVSDASGVSHGLNGGLNARWSGV